MRNIGEVRDLFVDFIQKNNIDSQLQLSSIRTSHVDEVLKYERIEVYKVSMLLLEDLRKITGFVTQYHDYIDCWFAFGELHIGFRIPAGYRCTKLTVFNEAG